MEPCQKRQRRSFVRKLRPSDKQIFFGAEVVGLDLASVNDEEFDFVRSALSEHLVLVFRGQGSVDPASLADFTHRFDPAAKTIWRDQATNPWERYKAEHMGPAGTFQLPASRSGTLVIGKGEVKNHFGLDAMLGGARPAYGKTAGSQVLGGGQLQWHIDGAFWGSGESSGWPCRVTCMRCWEAPETTKATEHLINYGDGSTLVSPLGATVFCSARHAYQLLTASEQEQALRTSVHYAAHPFKRFSKCSMTRDGLRCLGTGEEPVEESEQTGAITLPLIWTDPQSGLHALMPHTRCLEYMEVTHVDGSTSRIGLEESRAYLHTLMRRAIDPKFVYAHTWQSGDVVIWDNHAIWHSATGGLREEDRRVMHLVAYDGSEPPRLLLPSAALELHEQRRQVLALTIGQSPREDLVGPLRAALNTLAMPLEIVERGALDGISSEEICKIQERSLADCKSCPLVTRLADGTVVTVSEAEITSLLAVKLATAAGECTDIAAAIILCAGGFGALRAPAGLPLLRPFDNTAAVVASLGLNNVALLVPIESQSSHAKHRWQSRLAHLNCTAYLFPQVADGGEAEVIAKMVESGGHEAVILDFFGHPPELARNLHKHLSGKCVLDVGATAIAQLVAILR